MSDPTDRRAPSRGQRLPSVFDVFPVGTPFTLDDLERAMAADTERRILAVLDRVLVRQPDGDDLNLAPTRPA